MCARVAHTVTEEAAERLEKINRLWQELSQLPHNSSRTARYRQLVEAIRVEADALSLALRDRGELVGKKGTS
jgi:hypothetical protein